jgi:glycosyltransferase involved in cell wall biosynthesis
MQISAVIPTYNRKESVLRALRSLEEQTLVPGSFEAIVVDDGSSDDTPSVAEAPFPFDLRYVRQENRGATEARNAGALASRGEILIFIDDDVVVSPAALEELAALHQILDARTILMGTVVFRGNLESARRPETGAAPATRYEPVPFARCNTQLLAIKRRDFMDLGMFQDPTGGRGWPNWDDVDFGYRAHCQGFQVLRSNRARAEHWTYAFDDLSSFCQRWRRASRSAVLLFQEHPGLVPHVPMLLDKMPINWQQDTPSLVARKLARRLVSAPPMRWGMERTWHLLDRYRPSSGLLSPLRRWLMGSYLLQGFREGLHLYGPVEGGERAV